MNYLETMTGRRIPTHRLYHVSRNAQGKLMATWEGHKGTEEEELLQDPEESAGQLIPAQPGYYTVNPVEDQEGDPDFDQVLTFPVVAWRIFGTFVEPLSAGPESTLAILAPDGHVYDGGVIYESVQDWGRDHNGRSVKSDGIF